MVRISMTSEAWVYVVYDSWTAKNAYFSTADFADEFVEQERFKEIRPEDQIRSRYYVYSYRVDSGKWD
jgi:hypothetical protein